MTETQVTTEVGSRTGSSAAAAAAPLGIIDRRSDLTGRRVLFAVLVVATIAVVLGLTATALSADGLGALDAVLLALLLIVLPWSVTTFWNAVIFLILRLTTDPLTAVLPAAARIRGDEPITASVALMMCIRNEDPARVIRNLGPMLDGLAPVGDHFHLYALSDTNDPAIAIAEEKAFGALAAVWRGRIAVTYRRRDVNTGFKAGNIRDFCLRFGGNHELGVTLDADSFMPASAILRMVRIMQVAPEIGILQGLIAAMPSTSAFPRLFQFGMRLRMWSFSIGNAWWQADCGPHWGHNSVLRLKPFTDYCDIPPRPEGGPLGGHILSHDQIEAVLMRRTGYEVRLLLEDQLGWEENPPTLLEFIRRDVRWCQGNLQYWFFLTMPGLKPVSRYQLAFAIWMFFRAPAWIGLLLLGTVGVVTAANPSAFMAPRPALAAFVIVMMTWFVPKLATVADVLAHAKTRRFYGGGALFLFNVAVETVFHLMLLPIMWFSDTLFMVNLLFGRSVGWGGQARDDHAVPLSAAVARLWPHTLLGCACLAALAVRAPAAVPYALLIAGGLALAIPFCVVTANPAFGALLLRAGIGCLPEETAPSPLDALRLPALESIRRSRRTILSVAPFPASDARISASDVPERREAP